MVNIIGSGKELFINEKNYQENNYILEKLQKECFFIIIGCLFMAMGTSLFLLPNQLSSGGFAGIATIIYYLFSLPLGYYYVNFKYTAIYINIY